MTTQNRVPRWRLMVYSLGNFGMALATFSMFNLISYFYFPPVVDGSEAIPALITRSAIFAGLTILGLITASGRIFDAFTDPIIANMSDRSTSRFGRRRIFMMLSFIPLAATAAMVFFPPNDTPTTLNAIWLCGAMFLAFIFMTMYGISFGALVPELGKTSEDRVFIATCNSVAWTLSFALGQGVWAFKGMLEADGMTGVEAIRVIVAAFSVIGAIAMLMPILVIDENKYCGGKTSTENAFDAVKSAFKNRNFRIFTLVNCLAFMATFFLEAGAIYYVTMLMGLPEEKATFLMMGMFGLSVLFFPLVGPLAKRFAKKTMMRFSLISMAVLFGLISLLSYMPDPILYGSVIVIALAIPTALNTVLPAAIGADIARAATEETGEAKEGVYVGAGSFSIKMATSLTTLIFPSLLIIGSMDGETVSIMGVSLTAAAGALLALIGFVAMKHYNEESVLGSLHESRTAEVTPESA